MRNSVQYREYGLSSRWHIWWCCNSYTCNLQSTKPSWMLLLYWEAGTVAWMKVLRYTAHKTPNNPPLQPPADLQQHHDAHISPTFIMSNLPPNFLCVYERVTFSFSLQASENTLQGCPLQVFWIGTPEWTRPSFCACWLVCTIPF